MSKNPFELTFGRTPNNIIARYSQQNEIIDEFTKDSPSQQTFMITGVRGSGKTVFMTTVAKVLEGRDEWIVIDLNSSGDLFTEFAAKLYNYKGLSRKFEAEGINLSFFGIGINIKKAEPITEIQTAVERMLEQLAKGNKRILITIDEVSNTKEMRYFAGAYQIMIRHELPIFLLMTGLYENINRLQNEENLTFLFRAPKIYLNALNTYRMAEAYESLLNKDKEEALELAKSTKGYSFAFQVIGYFMYESNGDYDMSMPEIRQYLDEYVYDKIWIELSEKETEFLNCIADKGINEAKRIKEYLNMKPNEYSVYRDRLIRKGILNGSKRGKLDFAIPYFDDYLKERI